MEKSFVIKHIKGQSFEDYLEIAETQINSLNISQIYAYREELKKRVDALNELLKEEETKESRRAYLKGLRMVSTRMLAYSKRRLATFHRAVHNGTSVAFSKAFVEIAAAELDIHEFQRIYGKAADHVEMDSHSIEDVKKFLAECRKLNEEINGNK